MQLDDDQFNDISAKMEKEYGSLYEALEPRPRRARRRSPLSSSAPVQKEIIEAAREKISLAEV